MNVIVNNFLPSFVLKDAPPANVIIGGGFIAYLLYDNLRGVSTEINNFLKLNFCILPSCY